MTLEPLEGVENSYVGPRGGKRCWCGGSGYSYHRNRAGRINKGHHPGAEWKNRMEGR